MKLRIMIENQETGEVFYKNDEARGLAGGILTEDGVHQVFIGNLSPMDAAKLMDANDRLKEKIFKENPVLLAAWIMKDKLFKMETSVDFDIETIRKMAEGQ